MSAGGFGYAIGVSLFTYLWFLILLGLLALIPPLRQRFAIRNVAAWLLATMTFGMLMKGPMEALLLAAALTGFFAWLRYWLVMRKVRAAQQKQSEPAA